MKKFRTIAVDDEAPALRRLLKMIEENTDLQLIASAKSASEAKEVIIELKPDILLLDIQLKDATAFELLSEIKNDFSGKIIFITAYDQYAVKAFEYEAIDYLLKPYSQERFDIAINRIISKNEFPDLSKLIEIFQEKQNSSKSLMIPEGNKNYFLESEKLHYVSADGYYSNFIMENERKMIRISLKKLEEILPENFIRINKSIIINKNFIVELISNKSSSKLTMPDGNEFDVSDKYLEEFMRLIH
ncbi:MAG TPA: LytTR family DNA-binding domain-containing protein [Moheibacter sp.]|nr:LytTR family DNA-binding domain-containing protein [Moheibacter sp.]